jgi:hypothetical protein
MSNYYNRYRFWLSGITLILSIASFFFLYLKYYQNFISDDVFIFLCNANNIALNGDYACNGEVNYSSTSFLYPYLIAGIQITGSIDSVYAARLCSALFFVLTIAFIYGHILKTQNHIISIYAISLFIVNPFILRWFSTGMESTFAGFTLLVIYLFNFYKKHIITTLISGVLVLIRPEFIVVGPILIITSGLVIRRKLWLLGVWGVLLSLSLTFIFQEVNQILPNSFYGKVYKSELFNTQTLFLNAGTWFFAVFALFFITFVSILNGGININININKLWGHLLLLFVFLIYTIKSKLFLSRYFIFYIPVLIVESLSVNIQSRARELIILSTVTFSIAVSMILTTLYVGPSSQNFANNFQKIYRSLSIDFNNQENAGDLRIWATDVGILALYAKKYTVCDPIGLVDKRRFDFKSDFEYFNYCKPDFIVTRDDDLSLEINNVISEHYTFVSEYNLGRLGVLDSKERLLKVFKKNEDFK